MHMRKTDLQEGDKVLVIILELAPSSREGWHQNLNVGRILKSTPNCISKSANRIVQNQHIFTLVFLESQDEIAQDWFEVGDEFRTSILFKSGKSATSRFLNSLVVVKNHAKELKRSKVRGYLC
jgi:hypothetical protein